MTESVSQDFVFGTLAADDLRLAQLRGASAGVLHADDLHPADPGPSEPVVVGVSIGALVHADRVTREYTTDGSEPAGELGL
jgi:cyclomaltodextrinase